MTACRACLLHSLLQNQAAGFAEASLVRPADARRLLNGSADALSSAVRRHSPELQSQLDRQVDELLGERGKQLGLWLICRHDPDFPAGLRQLSDPPVMLYGLGDFDLLARLATRPAVALVGARRASSYGRDVAYRLAADVATAGLTVVSGMALGIDGAAHRGALSAVGSTIAVLAGGPERPYPPSHARLHTELVEQGIVLSERPPGSRAQKWGFPARNRIIAGLADLTIMVEGTVRSGARHTVEFAEQLHQTPGAVPGPVTSPLSAGPLQLLAEGAHMIRDVNDVLDVVLGVGSERQLPGLDASRSNQFGSLPDGPRRNRSAEDQLTGELNDVDCCIRSGDASPQAIATQLPALSPRQIAQAIGQLELRGRIERDNRGGYRQALPSRIASHDT